MVAGHLRKQNGYFQMILSYKYGDGKRRTKSISTGLQIKGNQKRAEAMLLEPRKNFNSEDAMTDKNTPFHKFLEKWLKDKMKSLDAETFALYSYNVKIFIKPYFEKSKIRICDLKTSDIESYYNHEKSENRATKTVIL
ncbi:N-terminal phage integrase SAM-like domain-containing protein [Anaeromonas gelatinilytica]|uniref:N-terminal phage integrase SAM-like domain-containing protein n=1 Tax=Anaeromonas gelatinilytica TaxID=2683194 RepID=UPI0020788C9B|nr:N-terminal phage integrase SAM-like domain-containing protein [Anaeromonas gelatinilytica]